MATTMNFLAEPANTVEFLEIDEVPTIVQKVRSHPMDTLHEVFDTAYGAIFTHAEDLGVSFTGPAFALYTSMPTNVVSLEAGMPVDRPLAEAFTTNDGVVIEPSVLPGGTVARTSYFGAYDGLGEAWGTFMQAITDAGKHPDLPYWELYVSEPGPDVDPATLRTDLFIRIRD